MTYLQFKTFTAAAISRSLSSLVVNGVDLLGSAVNMARKNIERKRDFELAKTSAKIAVPLGEAVDLSTAVHPVSLTAVDIKTVLAAQLASSGAPIGYMSRDAHQRRLSRQLARVGLLEMDSGLTAVVGSISLVRHGNRVYLSPGDPTAYGVTGGSIDVLLDVVAWMDEYAEDDDTDFLLTYCVDYMMLETFRYLQLFVKEDARLHVSDQQYANAWHAVVAWDSNLVVGDSDDANLD
jgi:hypothetical protein